MINNKYMQRKIQNYFCQTAKLSPEFLARCCTFRFKGLSLFLLIFWEEEKKAIFNPVCIQYCVSGKWLSCSQWGTVFSLTNLLENKEHCTFY